VIDEVGRSGTTGYPLSCTETQVLVPHAGVDTVRDDVDGEYEDPSAFVR
jgi:hypothetical protein